MSTSRTAVTFDVIERFNDAFNRHDVDAIMALMTNDSQAAVRAAWNALFSSPPSARFETEDVVACDDRRTV